MGLEALPSYKEWWLEFPGPVEDKERQLQRLRWLNQGLNTSQWRVYESKGESKGVCTFISTDPSSVGAWRGRGGVLSAVWNR
jgi:hypothetical protein